MSKADNMLSILWLLQSGKRKTAKQLAESLEIHVRTVYRYIDALCASGVPIIADSGHNGGYSLLEPFNEAPLYFELQEQKALIHAAAFAQEAGYPFGDALDRAVAKLKRYTNEEQRDAIDRHVIGFDVIPASSDSTTGSVLQQLEMSVAERRTLEMEYVTGRESVSKSRRIDPYGLVYWKGKWYIIAYCHLRLEIRSFRTDRIVSLDSTDVGFERPHEFSARHFFMKNLLPDPDNKDHLVSVRIRGGRQAIDDLAKHWLMGHVLIERTENEVHFMVDEQNLFYQVPYYLFTFGRSIKVMEPPVLIERLVEITEKQLEYYRTP